MSIPRSPDGSLVLVPPDGIKLVTSFDKRNNLHSLTVSFDHKVTLVGSDEAAIRYPESVVTMLNHAVEQLAANVRLHCEEILVNS